MYLVIKQPPVVRGFSAAQLGANHGPTIHRFETELQLKDFIIKNGTENIEIFDVKKMEAKVAWELKHVEK